MVDILVRNRADFSKRKICENWSKTNTQHLLNAEKILNYDGKKSPGKKIMQNNSNFEKCLSKYSCHGNVKFLVQRGVILNCCQVNFRKVAELMLTVFSQILYKLQDRMVTFCRSEYR